MIITRTTSEVLTPTSIHVLHVPLKSPTLAELSNTMTLIIHTGVYPVSGQARLTFGTVSAIPNGIYVTYIEIKASNSSAIKRRLLHMSNLLTIHP